MYCNNQKTTYNLAYHLSKAENLRIKGKLRTLISYMTEKYDCSVIFSKRRIWFYLDKKRIMQVIVYKSYLYLKIRTQKGWIETKLPDWEDFRRLAFYLRYLEKEDCV